MGPLVVVVIVLGVALLAVTAYMEWVGVMTLFTPRSATRYEACGHIRALPFATDRTRCWSCRHPHLHDAVEATEHPFHHHDR
jgi:hypothetical protein